MFQNELELMTGNELELIVELGNEIDVTAGNELELMLGLGDTLDVTTGKELELMTGNKLEAMAANMFRRINLFKKICLS